jgi:phosphoadenosine phosphosulfate reductase
VSWGKDSTVLFDLLARADFRSPVIWLTYGRATNPECRAVRDAMLSRRPGLDYREVDVGEAEEMRDDFRPASRTAGADRYILGIRADESRIRRMSLRRLGLDTGRACRPLGWWRLPDVFGYLAANGLPVHPNYAMLGGGRWPREHIRTASIGGERGVEHGRRAWESEYFGDVLRRLAAGAR